MQQRTVCKSVRRSVCEHCCIGEYGASVRRECATMLVSIMQQRAVCKNVCCIIEEMLHETMLHHSFLLPRARAFLVLTSRTISAVVKAVWKFWRRHPWFAYVLAAPAVFAAAVVIVVWDVAMATASKTMAWSYIARHMWELRKSSDGASRRRSLGQCKATFGALALSALTSCGHFAVVYAGSQCMHVSRPAWQGQALLQKHGTRNRARSFGSHILLRRARHLSQVHRLCWRIGGGGPGCAAAREDRGAFSTLRTLRRKAV